MHRTLVSAVFTVLALNAVAADGPPAPDSPEATQFGYPSPEAALAALRERQGVSIYPQGGWTIADDKPNYTMWSFTPSDHPAHPTGVKRVIVKAANGDISIMMTARCGASKSVCDKLIAEFRTLNDRMAESIRAKTQGKQQGAPQQRRRTRTREKRLALWHHYLRAPVAANVSRLRYAR